LSSSSTSEISPDCASGAGSYNVGIAPGPSGLLVIDLDAPKPGQVTPPRWREPGISDGTGVLTVLCEEAGEPFPGETFTVRTGRGRLHLYFTAPPGTALRNASGEHGGLGWLIDTRAHGGYILAPGSAVDLPDGSTRTGTSARRCGAAGLRVNGKRFGVRRGFGDAEPTVSITLGDSSHRGHWAACTAR